MATEHKIEITYKEENGSIQVQMNSDGLSPYTLIGVFEHFIGRIKKRLDGTDVELINQEN